METAASGGAAETTHTGSEMRNLWLAAALLVIACLPSAGTERVVTEWRFDRPEVLADWETSGIEGATVTDGAVQMSCPGGDPLMIYRKRFEIRTSPWQILEIRLRSDRSGLFEVFWSGTDQGPYGGFAQEKTTSFAVAGDNRWHTIRVIPAWQREGSIIRLRLDPFTGAHMAIASVRVLEPMTGTAAPAQPTFDFRRSAQGWSTFAGAECTEGRSGARIRLTADDGMLVAPPVAIDADRMPVVSVRLTAVRARRAVLLFVTDAAYGIQLRTFDLTADGKPHTYNLDMLSVPGWRGKVVGLALRPGELVGDSCILHAVHISDKPEGPASLRITSFGAEDALPRTGVDVHVTARAENNGGGIARMLRASLQLPAGARAVRNPVGSPSSLTFGEEATWRWTVRFARSTTSALRVAIRAAGLQPVTATSTLHVTPRITAHMGAPKAVHGKLDVGVYYFPGWKTANSWAPITRYPERRPILGWYREGDPDVAEWHVRWAVEHGITFFAYDWYWSQGSRSLEHALHEGLFHAPDGKLLKFCLLWANHNAPGTSSRADLSTVTRYWIDNYFRRPEYYTIDGKPVVIIFAPSRIREDMPQAEIRASFEDMRRICRDAGLPGLMLIACVGGVDDAQAAAREGYDAITAYNWPSLNMGSTGKSAPFERLISGYHQHWESLVKDGGLPILTPVSGGWDNRPWAGDAALVRTNRTPALFQRHLEDAKQFVEQHPKTAMRAVLIEAWNELGEGSYIEPHRQYGFGYLDAIRRVFVGSQPAHLDYTPADIGKQVPQVDMDTLARTSWSFAKDLQGWSSMMEMTEAAAANGALSTQTTGTDPAFASPPLQLRATSWKAVRLRIRLQSQDAAPFQDTVQLFWSSRAASASEETSVRADVRGDGLWHDIVLPVATNPRWHGIVTGMRLDPCNRKDVSVDIQSITLVR